MHEGGVVDCNRIDGDGGEEAGAADRLLTAGKSLEIEEEKTVADLHRRCRQQSEGVFGHEVSGRNVDAVEELVGDGIPISQGTWTAGE